MVLAVSLIGWRQLHETNNLAAELLDQHLATLSSAATPQVISTDRHTVKPWFQGRLPFSFNLPDPQGSSTGDALNGADLTYLKGQPAALLLFTIHKHEVSVFVTQRFGGPNLAALPSTRSGFTIHSATTHDLQIVAVSDVNPADLDAPRSYLGAGTSAFLAGYNFVVICDAVRKDDPLIPAWSQDQLDSSCPPEIEAPFYFDNLLGRMGSQQACGYHGRVSCFEPLPLGPQPQRRF